MDCEEPPNCKFISEVPTSDSLSSFTSAQFQLQPHFMAPELQPLFYSADKSLTAVPYVFRSGCTSVVPFWSQLHGIPDYEYESIWLLSLIKNILITVLR